MARAKPSWAIRDTMPHCSLSSVASVRTTARVVFSIPPNTGADAIARRDSLLPTNRPSRRAPAKISPCSSITSPRAFTTVSAATVTPPPICTEAKPTPPFIIPWKLSNLPTVAPVPAPTEPSSTVEVAALAAS